MDKQKIIDAGVDWTIINSPRCLGGGHFADMIRKLNRNAAFEAGAIWAIEQQQEADISRVCEWLKGHLKEYLEVMPYSSNVSVNDEDLINDLTTYIKNEHDS